MVSRQCADATSRHHGPHRWTLEGGLVQRIDKADLLGYKHNALAIERPWRRCECL
jgi:hypothetical protein